MMEQETFFGPNSTLTGREALLRLEAALSEGLLLPAGVALPDAPNLWGRLPMSRATADLSVLTGLAATGLRCAAIVEATDLAGQREHLHALSRQLLPVVLHLLLPENDPLHPAHVGGHQVYHDLNAAGFFQFFAADAREAIDLAIIAHRVAEEALVPGIVALEGASAPFTQSSVTTPAREALLRFLGAPDDLIPCPTPAQRILFGKARRRIPNWFNFDLPGLLGAAKTTDDQVLAAAARQQYIQRHLPDLLLQAMIDFEARFGRKYTPVGAYQAEKADYLILTQGAAFGPAVEAVDYLRSREKARVGCLNLRQFRPFPAPALLAWLTGKKSITILESISGQAEPTGPIWREVSAAMSAQTARLPALFAGYYGETPSPEAIIRAFRNSMRGGDGLRHFYLDLAFTRSSSVSPQHEVLLQSIAREYPDLDRLSLLDKNAPNGIHLMPSAPAASELPQVVRRYQDQGPPYSQVARFYHNTALFHHSGDKPERVADPFQTTEMAPPATALLGNRRPDRDQLPVFRPEKCTGCGQCVVYCPHAALPPLVIGLEALIHGGLRMAAARGEALSQFTPLVKNLARLASRLIQSAETPVVKAGDVLPAALDQLLAQSSFSEEREVLIRREWSVLLPGIAEFPMALTDTFFTIPEQREKGSGALFSLAIDPGACTGCGLCAEVCETNAFDLAPATPEGEAQLRTAYSLWEQLPDTAPEWIHRLVSEPSYDPFAAILLSRHYYQSMAGGSPTEEGAPAKTILHLLVSLVESVVQPHIVKQIRKLDELIETLSTAIHTRMSDALPHHNFQTLEQTIREAGGEQLSLEELVGRLGAREHLQRIDTDTLHRHVALVNDLHALRRALSEGPTGVGRARYGLVLQKNAWPWVSAFPDNVFLTPVALEEEAFAVGRATGLMEGHLRHALDQIRLLRRAHLEARGQYRPEIHAREIAGLSWENLKAEEKEYVAPVLLVGNRKLLGPAFDKVAALLRSDRPVKIVVLDDGAGSGSEESTSFQSPARYSLFIQQQAFVLEGVLEASADLFTGLQQGLQTPRPAFFHLYAPVSEHHRPGGAGWPDLSALALRSRAFPSVICIPEDSSGGRPGDLSLKGNPEAEAPWCTVELSFTEEGAEKTMAYTLTYADWLFTHQSWQDHFSPLPATSSDEPIPLAGYLGLDPGARSGKTPVIAAVNPAGERQIWAVSAAVVQATQIAARQWRLLQHLGGIVTAFPQKLRQELAQELAEAHAAELAQLRTTQEEQWQRREQELMEQVKIRLREKLLALSQQRAG